MYGIGGERELDEDDARPPRRATRARGRCASATAPTTRSSTTSGARCSTRSTCTRSRATSCPSDVWPILARQVEAAIDALARARPRHLGGPRRAASTSPPRRSCAGSPATAARAWRGCARTHERAERWQAAADEIHADVLRATASTSAACSCQHYDTDALDASLPAACRSCASCRPTTSASVATVIAIADELTDRRPRAALPGRGDRRRAAAARRARSRSARSGWSARCAEIGELDRARALCEKLLGYASPLLPLRRGDRRRAPAATSATSRRRSRTWR